MDESLHYSCIDMEWAERGNLRHVVLMEKVDVDERFCHAVAYAGLSAILSLEQVKIIHGDIKPENFLVTDKWVFKISDFSNSSFQGKLLIN